MKMSDFEILRSDQDMCECCHEVSEPGEKFGQVDGAIMCPGCLEDYRKDHPDLEALVSRAEYLEDR
jgi:hypothetical protein